MPWSVQFTPEAIEELQRAIDYYDDQRLGLGIDFMIEFEKQIQQLILNPLSRAVRYLNVRFALIERFPYAIHFVVNEDRHTIIVQTVLSTFRNPDEHWIKR
jgi:ParE-like toxin of type II ParDE toxin-antitoxin system